MKGIKMAAHCKNVLVTDYWDAKVRRAGKQLVWILTSAQQNDLCAAGNSHKDDKDEQQQQQQQDDDVDDDDTIAKSAAQLA